MTEILTNYIIAAVVGLCEVTILALFCWKKMHILFGDSTYTNTLAEGNDNLTSEDTKKASTTYYSKSQSVVILIISLIIFEVASIFLINNTNNYFGFIKLSAVLLAVVIAALTDFKLRIIPNMIILVGLAIRVIIYVFEILYCNDEILEIAKNDLIGLAIGFGVLFIAHLISRSSIGMGDVKLFGLIGVCSGAICTYSTLLISLILNTIVSVILLILKKKGKKDSIPFAPAICVGYIASIFIASF